MAYKIEIDKKVEKDLSKIDKNEAKRIYKFLQQKISVADDPMIFAKTLQGSLVGYFRFRVGNYRIIFKPNHKNKIIKIITIAHRKESYH